jgi:hypothetical protein
MTNPLSALTGHSALKTAAEYPIPANQQTHGIVSPVERLLLASQQPGSTLVKVRVDRDTGRLISAVSHVIHDPFAGLHGLHISHRYRVMAVALAVPIALAAADFWRSKDPDQWTGPEVKKIRTNSPWAKQIPQERHVSRAITSKKAHAEQVTTEQKKVWRPSGKDVCIRWESAAPILATTAKFDLGLRTALSQLAKDYYVVSVTGLTLPAGYTKADGLNDLAANSHLVLGQKLLSPSKVELLGDGEGAVHELLFSRGARIEDLNDDIVVSVHCGNIRAHATFKVKEMSFQGQFTL